MAARVLLILGYGPNVGGSTASKFARNGYKVAIASRSVTPGLSPTTGFYGIKTDFSQAETVASAFATVEAELGTPNVVLYNPAGNTAGSVDDPLSPSLSDFDKDIHINFLSLLAAAKEAVRGFRTLPPTAPKAFFFTGNKLSDPLYAMPQLLSMASGKVASSFVVRDAASGYAKDGFRFYYMDERQKDGGPIFRAISGEAHAEELWKLTESNQQEAWCYTFVKGVGYKKFD